MAEQLRFGVIGAGRIGRLHIEHLMRRIEGAAVVAVSDVVRDAAEAAASQFGVPSVTADAGEGRQAHVLREAHRPRPRRDR